MLDEPLGQLDRSLRERLVVELRELFGRLGTTVLAVTHDQGEAFALADRVIVMRDGRIAQSGTPLEVWQRPVDEFVARFLGFDNVVEATVSGQVADTPWGKVPVPEGTGQGVRTLLVRPAGVRLVSAVEGLRCSVAARTFRGTHVAVRLQPEDAPRLEAACALREAPESGTRLGWLSTWRKLSCWGEGPSLFSPPPPLPVPSLGAAPPDPPFALDALVLKRRTGWMVPASA